MAACTPSWQRPSHRLIHLEPAPSMPILVQCFKSPEIDMIPSMTSPAVPGAEAFSKFGACSQALADHVIMHAKSREYADKTLLFCWEHHSIPHIIARLGLTSKSLHWGLRPESQVLASFPARRACCDVALMRVAQCSAAEDWAAAL